MFSLLWFFGFWFIHFALNLYIYANVMFKYLNYDLICVACRYLGNSLYVERALKSETETIGIAVELCLSFPS